jgi:hypothetical protein
MSKDEEKSGGVCRCRNSKWSWLRSVMFTRRLRVVVWTTAASSASRSIALSAFLRQSNTRQDFHFKLARDHNKRHWTSECLLLFWTERTLVGYGEYLQDKYFQLSLQHGYFQVQSASTMLTKTEPFQSQLDPLPRDLPFRIISKTIGRGAYASYVSATKRIDLC